MLLDYLLLPMVCYLLIGIYMNEFVAATNILGVKVAGRINTVAVGAQVLFAVALIVISAVYVTRGNGSGSLVDSAALFNASTFHAHGVLWAASILAASFLGFDAVSTMAEETVDPAKTVPRAVLIVPIGAGIGFSIISYVMQIAWPGAATELQDPDSGIFELLGLASMICAIAGLAAASRILYGMGRDGALPRRFFGALNRRFQTPVNNILLMTAVALTGILYSDNLIGAAPLVAFGALSGFILVNYSVISHHFIRGRRRTGIDLVRYMVLPGLGMVVCAVLLVNVDVSAKILGLVWLAAGVIYLGVTTRGFRTPPADLGMSEDEPPGSPEQATYVVSHAN